MSESSKPNRNGHTGLDELRDEVAGGLRYAHTRANANTGKLLEVASFAYAAIELLSEKGLLPLEELDERKKTVAGRLVEKFADQGMGVVYQSPEHDKYSFAGEVRIDCENRLHLCKAACCKLRFALSKQDVEEGIVKWEFARPYLIARGPDGYCQHVDRNTLGCSIHPHRPVPCRAYDCRKDQRIWLDFDQKIPNPRIHEPDWPQGIEASPAGEDAAALQPIRASTTPDAPGKPDGGLFGVVSRFLQEIAARPVFLQYRNRVVMGYGMFLSAGFGLGILYALYLILYRFQRVPPPGLAILGLAFAAYFGSIIVYIAERELAKWLNQSAISTRGHTLYGGILGSLVYWIILYRTDPGSLLFYADCAAPAIALGYAIGKIGCLSYGCCVGRPTQSRLAVRYTAEISKAVGYYELKGVPLAPVQLYEVLMGLGFFVFLSTRPDAAYGTGQVLGWLFLLLGLGRFILLWFRYHFPDERASIQVAVTINLAFVALSIPLLGNTGSHPQSSIAFIPTPADSIPFVWPILVSAIGAALVLCLFGIHSLKADG